MEEEAIAAAAASLFQAYIAGRASSFYEHHPADAHARAASVERAVRPLATEIASALRAQNALLAASSARETNLTALESGAAAVVTGQQVGLFLGPLYTLYKAATAIAVSRALARETGRNVVPIFWLQTEDHDVPEVATCSVPRDGHAPIELRVPSDIEARISIAHAVLPDEVSTCVETLREELARLPHAAAHLERIARAYRPGEAWAKAFAHTLAALFAPEGLIVIDPRDPVLARHASLVHRRALGDAAELAEGLCARVEALRKAGFTAQVHVRPGAPLCFFHPERADAQRTRLVPCERGYAEVGTQAEHTSAELLAVLDRDPLRFSTSALLRPIVQDTLLPTAAYVGGPSEVEYFAQLQPLYAAFGLAMPLIVPRARFRVLEEKTVRLLERLGLHADDAAKSEDEILGELAARRTDRLSSEALERDLKARFDAAMDAALAPTGALRSVLQSAEEKTQSIVHTSAAKLAEKYRRAVMHQNEELVRDVQRLRHALHPNGAPQERVYGFAYFAARYGERAFIERVLEAIEPFGPAAKDLFP